MKKAVLIVSILFTFFSANAQTVKVMSYNIRLALASDGVNAWDNRREMFAGQVGFYEPDFMGVQEALPNQVNYLDTTLTYLKHIGIAREGVNKGEASSIFYNYSKFQLLQTNTFWLSETPDVISKGWDASYIRVCTYGLFKEKKSGKKFWVFNTHLDNDGLVARTKGIALILKKIEKLNQKNLPVILMGDFNTTPETALITYLKLKMNDAKDISISKPFGPVGTFNGFKYDKPVTQKIDYIFVSKSSKITVNKFAVLSNADDLRYPSDHLPVYAEIVMK
jgi:endonuclease/exonuclease/phosphatase family metal-dependent hydrolase